MESKGNKSNSQQSSKRELENSNKNNKITLNAPILIISILIIIETILIVFAFLIKKNASLSLCVFGGAGLLDIVFVAILKTIFNQEITKIADVLKNRDENKKILIKKVPPQFITIAILCFTILFTSTVGGIKAQSSIDIKKDSPPPIEDIKTQPTTTDPPEEIKPPYDFSTVTDNNKWPDHYFYNESEENTFVDNLEDSVRAIKKEEPISDAELEIMSDYGTIVEDANAHYNYLVNDILNSTDYIINGPLPNECYLYIHKIRAKMEDTCKTPANRKEIMNCYLLGGLHDLGEKGAKYEYEQAVRYAWGTLYIRIAWNQYVEEDILNIINAYEHLLKEASPEEVKQIELIIQSLKRLQVRLNDKPPKPIL